MLCPVLAGTGYEARYLTLDAWRAVAALSVLFHHQMLGRVDAVYHGWLGVQLFFVISGYCMAAATDGAIGRGASVGSFMRRRVRRIYPPYLASVVLLVLVHLIMRLVGPEGSLQRALDYLDKPWVLWLQNLTMTQWVTIPLGNAQESFLPAAAQNPSLLLAAYWSLNYEEQFYLVCALGLLAARYTRPGVALVAVTVCAAAFNALAPGFVTGLFIDYWLQFSVGIWVYVRLRRVRSSRAAQMSDGLLMVAAVACFFVAEARGEVAAMSWRTYDFYAELAVCLTFALALVALRRFDARIFASRPGRWLCLFGTMSYSLYLFHHSLLEVFEMIESAAGLPAPAGRSAALEVLCAAFVSAGAAGLHRVFERPFLVKGSGASR
jgi:peptidoglycan/LPS O-acetylase OafA/YrhL